MKNNYEWVGAYSEGKALVRLTNGKWAFIDAGGKVITDKN